MCNAPLRSHLGLADRSLGTADASKNKFLRRFNHLSGYVLHFKAKESNFIAIPFHGVGGDSLKQKLKKSDIIHLLDIGRITVCC